MPNITTCTNCGRCYEAGSDEQANEWERFCSLCRLSNLGHSECIDTSDIPEQGREFFEKAKLSTRKEKGKKMNAFKPEKPCRFCGSKDISVHNQDWYIKCNGCGVIVLSSKEPSVPAAVKFWDMPYPEHVYCKCMLDIPPTNHDGK